MEEGIIILTVDRAGEYRFRFQLRNGQILGSSEGYASKAGCRRGVESVRRNASKADIVEEGYGRCPKFELFSDRSGKFRFRLLASNGEAILASDAYSDVKQAEEACRKVQCLAISSPVEDHSV